MLEITLPGELSNVWLLEQENAHRSPGVITLWNYAQTDNYTVITQNWAFLFSPIFITSADVLVRYEKHQQKWIHAKWISSINTVVVNCYMDFFVLNADLSCWSIVLSNRIVPSWWAHHLLLFPCLYSSACCQEELELHCGRQCQKSPQSYLLCLLCVLTGKWVPPFRIRLKNDTSTSGFHCQVT